MARKLSPERLPWLSNHQVPPSHDHRHLHVSAEGGRKFRALRGEMALRRSPSCVCSLSLINIRLLGGWPCIQVFFGRQRAGNVTTVESPNTAYVNMELHWLLIEALREKAPR